MHAEDLSQLEKDLREDIIRKLNMTFGNECAVATTHGEALKYLGMTIDYSTKGR